MIRRRDQVPRALVRVSWAHPRLVLGLWLGGLLALAPGLFRVEIETTVDSILDKTAPEWSVYEDSKSLFGGDEIVVVMLQGGQPFSADVLADVIALSEELEAIPGVRRVDSLSTVGSVVSLSDSSVSVSPLLDVSRPRSPSELAELVGRDPFASANLASDDGRSLAINVWLEDGAHAQLPEIMGKIAAASEIHDAVYSGVPVFRWETNRRTQRELISLVPLTLAVLLVISFLMFRSWRMVAVPLATSGAATCVVLGAMGWLGTPLTVSTLILPTVLLALGVAYSSHLVFAVARSSDSPSQAYEALLATALPVALSGLTTTIGFVAISLVRIEAIQQIGGFGALGALICTALSLTAVPALLRLVSQGVVLPPFVAALESQTVDAVMRVVAGAGKPILVASAVIALISVVGAARMTVESDVVVWFPSDDPVRTSYEKIGAELSGISPLNVMIQGESGSLTTPEALRALSEFSAYLRSVPDVGKVVSLADPIVEVAGALGGVGTDALASSAEVEQYLLLLEGDRRITDLVTPDRSVANVLLRADDNGSLRLLEIARKAEAWWELNGMEGTEAVATGVMFEFARAEDAIAKGQLQGLAFAGITIGLLLWITFGSWQLAALALVPNALPILVSFGALGWLAIPLDAGTVLVGNLALGIAVDDTVHLIAGVSRASATWDWRRSVTAAMKRVFAPVLFTTLSLAAGFAVLGASGFIFIRNLGLLTAAVLVLCLLADLFLLPVLLRLAPRSRALSSG